MRAWTLTGLLCAALAAHAEGIDRDSLLSEAPAVPDKGTVRISGGATGTSDDGGVGGTQGQGNVAGSISWTPIQNLSGDVGAYWQARRRASGISSSISSGTGSICPPGRGSRRSASIPTRARWSSSSSRGAASAGSSWC